MVTEVIAPDTLADFPLLNLGDSVASVPSPEPTSMWPLGRSWRDCIPQLNLSFCGPWSWMILVARLTCSMAGGGASLENIA